MSRFWNAIKQALSGAPVSHGPSAMLKAAVAELQTIRPSAPAVDRFDARSQNRTQGELRSELTTFANLRKLADLCDVVSNAVQLRIDQIRSTPIEFQPKQDVEDEDAAKAQAEEARRFFSMPGGYGGPGVSFQDMLCIQVGDLLEIGCTSLYRRKTRGGDTYSLEYVDASTIKPLLTDGGWTPLPPEPAYQQYDGNGRPTDRKFAADEMRYIRFRARSNSRWGRSPVENVMSAVAQYIAADAYNLSWFHDGDGEWSYWEVPQDWTVEQIKQFDAYIRAANAALAGKQGAAARSIPSGPKRQSARQRSEAGFEKTQVHLVRRIARAFGLNATVLGFEGAQYKVSTEDQAKSAELWGENVIKLLLKELLDAILLEDLGLDLVEAVWQDEEEDLEPIARMVASAGTERVTPNEAREMLGLPPLEGGLASCLYVMTATGPQIIWAPPEVQAEQDAMAQAEAEAKADLARWQRKALKYLAEGHLHKCEFRSEAIPPPLLAEIADKLSKATDAAQVRAAFAVLDDGERPSVDLSAMAGNLEQLLGAVREERGRREGWA